MHRRPFALLAWAVVLALVGCQEGTGPESSTPSPDLTLAEASWSNATVAQGSSVVLRFLVTSQNGFQGTVTLSLTEGGSPVSWLDPNSLQRTLTLPAGGRLQDSLRVFVTSSAPTGSRTLRLSVQYGAQRTERDLSLTVTPPASFALALSPDSLRLSPGTQGTTQLTVTPQNGFTGTVALQLVDSQGNAVSGIGLQPTSVSVTGPNPVTQTLTVAVASTTTTGTYRLRLRGTSGSLSREANLTIVVAAPPGSGGVSWTQRLLEPVDLYAVTYGGGQFVAVDVLGNVITSTDGTTWSPPIPAAPGYVLWSVAYGAGIFVAVGGGGTILTSPDGRTWTPRSSPVTGNALLRDVVYAGNQFVAVGFSGTSGVILTSPDGVNWTLRSDSSTPLLFSVGYGNGMYVAGSSSRLILTSTDGVTWRVNSLSSNVSILGVAFGNGTFVAVGSPGAIFTSSDGVTWTERSSGTIETLWGVRFANNLFVATGDNGTILTSRDGATWTPATSNTRRTVFVAAFGAGTWVAAADGGLVLGSADGSSWSPRTAGLGVTYYGLAYGAGTFVAVGDGGVVLTSTDGITGTRQNAGVSDRVTLTDVVFGGNQFVAVGVEEPGRNQTPVPVVITSPDGRSWTRRSASDIVKAVTYGNGRYVAVGIGRALVSTDGVSWTSTQTGGGGGHMLNDVAFGNNLFVAVGYAGVILTSPDGTAWTERTSGTVSSLQSVTFANGQFVAVSTSGEVLTSTDGVTWTRRPVASGILKGVGFGNGVFVAVGVQGTIYTSTDGTTWTSRTSGTTRGLQAVGYGAGTFVAVGEGVILTSP